MSKTQEKKVLIIGGKNYSNRRILNELRLLGLKAQIALVKDFTISTSNRNGDDRIYHKDKRIYYSTINAIVPRIGKNFVFGTSVVRHMNNNNKCYTTSRSEGLINASNKQKCAQILSKARVQVPSTAYFQNVNNYKFVTDLVGGLPCVAKLVSGSQGKGVFILTDELSGSTALKTILLSQKVLLQEYLESSKKDAKKSDIRAWVVGDEVVASMKRYSIDKDFRSNYSISKSAEIVQLTVEEKELAVNAAKAIGLSLCGVDLIRDVKSEKTYVIECNGNASLLGIEKVTKVNVAKKIASFVYNKVIKEVDRTERGFSTIHEELSFIQSHLKEIKALGYKNSYDINADNIDGISFLTPPTKQDEESEMSSKKIPPYIEQSYNVLARNKSRYSGFSKSSNSLEEANNWIRANNL